MQDAKKRYLRGVYISRINRVINHIEANLSGELTLNELAEVASFSSFHFHRIFRAIVGETLYDFIQRLRIEKAASKLLTNPHRSITEISFECGFSSSAAFSRSFRETFKMSPTQWRQKHYSKNRIMDSKEGQIDSNSGQDFDLSLHYNVDTNKQIWRITMNKERLETKVEVKELPEMTVAYVRHIGRYQGDTELFGRLFQKLTTWAGPRGLLNAESKFLSVYYDDPDITEDSKLRVDVCVTVPADTAVDGEIGKETIAGGKYAVGHFEITPDRYGEAWNAIYAGWLPQSGYQPEDGPNYELYYADPKQHPEGKHTFDICIPVRPL
jgi:AraC family transcriptional regulator